MAYTFSDPHSQASQAAQARTQAMSRLRSTGRAVSSYHDDERKKLEREIKKHERAKEAEAKRRASNWTNWAALGSSVGSMFGGPLVGAGIGALFGGAKALASGGNPLDLGAQFKYADPSLMAGAAMSYANMPKPEAKKPEVPGGAGSGGWQGGEGLTDSTLGTQLENTYGMSRAQLDQFKRQQHMRQGHISAGRRNLIDRIGPQGGY